MSREAPAQTHQQTSTSHPLSQGSILQRQCNSCGQYRTGGGTCATCQSKTQATVTTPLPTIQTKLTVGQPNDKYEQEADRVAEQIMRMPISETVGRVRSHPPHIQRMCTNCEEEQTIQTSAAADHPPEVTSEIASRIQSLQGGGQPLPASARNFFEPRFGQDFSHVRVHTDESAQALHAKAYTLSSNIVFGPGQYAPHTSAGQHLLAHELTHVVQQQSARQSPAIQRVPARSPRAITDILVNQTTPQRVTITRRDGTTESDQCSTGKGHCCLDASASQGGVCSAAGSRRGGSNCTPLGNNFRVTYKTRETGGGVELWTQFHNGRSIALHEYRPVDGTPLSHGCVRLNRPMAQKIFDDSIIGHTKIRVINLAKPQCRHPRLQHEWLGDFRTAGQTPPDGETIDPRTGIRMEASRRRRIARNIQTNRRQLRSALGVNEAGLDQTIQDLSTASGNFARSTRAELRQSLAAVAPLIPRCVPTQTTEEALVPQAERARLTTVPLPLAQQLRRALRGAGSRRRARRVVRVFGQRLWRSAVRRAQTTPPDLDDRDLYWGRLQMAEVIRQWEPAWVRAMDPDRARRFRADLLRRFERASRGMEDIRFSGDRNIKRILISGFDPFNLGSSGNIRNVNPSGAAALALDGKRLTNGGAEARVQAVIFPVRFADFDQGMVETFFRPFLSGRNAADMVMTISRGGSREFEVEEFAGRRRSSGGFADNLGRTQGSRRSPVVPPGVGPGPEFLRTTLPTREIRSELGRTSPLRGETRIREIPTGRQRPRRRSRPTSGSIAVSGSGGGFLSNEIFYRTTLLRSQTGSTIPVGHLHTPNPNVTNAPTVSQIVSRIERI
ncbi:MAG: DUF4157 domain-containing protein, partial [Cyanobacteria bacterium P01_F01_bin.13]